MCVLFVFIRPHLSEHSAEVPSRATAPGSDLRMGLQGRSVPFHFFSSPKTSWRHTGREGSCGEGAPAGLCPWLVQDDCWVSGKGTHPAGGWGFNDVCGNLPGTFVLGVCLQLFFSHKDAPNLHKFDSQCFDVMMVGKRHTRRNHGPRSGHGPLAGLVLRGLTLPGDAGGWPQLPAAVGSLGSTVGRAATGCAPTALPSVTFRTAFGTVQERLDTVLSHRLRVS